MRGVARTFYCFQQITQVLIRLIEECRKNSDNHLYDCDCGILIALENDFKSLEIITAKLYAYKFEEHVLC